MSKAGGTEQNPSGGQKYCLGIFPNIRMRRTIKNICEIMQLASVFKELYNGLENIVDLIAS